VRGKIARNLRKAAGGVELLEFRDYARLNCGAYDMTCKSPGRVAYQELKKVTKRDKLAWIDYDKLKKLQGDEVNNGRKKV